MNGPAGDGTPETLRTGLRYRLGCSPSGYVIEDLLAEGHPAVEHYAPGLFDLAAYRYEQLEAATPPPPPAPGPRRPAGGTYRSPGLFPAPAPSSWCRGCGAGLYAGWTACTHCGRPLGARRDKRVAVALAVFLAFWTWLYTYDRDRGQFWAGLAIDVAGAALVWTGVGWAALVGVWIWSIAAAASRPAADYW